jgi:hypothetical protein
MHQVLLLVKTSASSRPAATKSPQPFFGGAPVSGDLEMCGPLIKGVSSTWLRTNASVSFALSNDLGLRSIVSRQDLAAKVQLCA